MSLINIVAWLLLGAVAGWIASKIMNRDGQMGAVGNIIVGILGAFIGGVITSYSIHYTKLYERTAVPHNKSILAFRES